MNDKLKSLCQLLADPENIPHQYMGDYDGLEKAIIDCFCAKGEIDSKGLLNAARPLIKYINDNGHPHMQVIVMPCSAEVLESIAACNTEEFIRG